MASFKITAIFFGAIAFSMAATQSLENVEETGEGQKLDNDFVDQVAGAVVRREEFRDNMKVERKVDMKEFHENFGKCPEMMSFYDVELGTCVNCSVERCEGNPSCIAQCKVAMEVYELEKRLTEAEILARSARAEAKSNDRKLNAVIIIFAVFVIIVAIGVAVLWTLRRYRFTKTKAPTGDEELPKYAPPEEQPLNQRAAGDAEARFPHQAEQN